jgi:hypothetical protein
MKPVCFVILLTTIAYGQGSTPNIQAESSGTCSPNILSNQGSVQFTCNAAIDRNTAAKIVSLLNRILQKSSDKENPTAEINQKLDGILEFLYNQAHRTEELALGVHQLQEQAEQRQLSSEQEAQLGSLLKPLAPQEIYFICAPDPESNRFADQISRVLNSAGWKTELHPYNWGTLERFSEGIQVWVKDIKQPNRAAATLQAALRSVGVHSVGLNFSMLEEGRIALYVGSKPSKTAP